VVCSHDVAIDVYTSQGYTYLLWTWTWTWVLSEFVFRISSLAQFPLVVVVVVGGGGGS
jgi:hypothetical protein